MFRSALKANNLRLPFVPPLLFAIPANRLTAPDVAPSNGVASPCRLAVSPTIKPAES